MARFESTRYVGMACAMQRSFVREASRHGIGTVATASERSPWATAGPPGVPAPRAANASWNGCRRGLPGARHDALRNRVAVHRKDGITEPVNGLAGIPEGGHPDAGPFQGASDGGLRRGFRPSSPRRIPVRFDFLQWRVVVVARGRPTAIPDRISFRLLSVGCAAATNFPVTDLSRRIGFAAVRQAKAGQQMSGDSFRRHPSMPGPCFAPCVHASTASPTRSTRATSAFR